ncbi:heme-dependent oxidative N-demethylase subunit alpha family protein [Rhodococcus triatomae]
MTLPAHISDLARLPWPFRDPDGESSGSGFAPAPEDGGHIVDPGPDYAEVMASRAATLAADQRRVRLSPHMTPACWDVMLYLMGRLAQSCPTSMELHRDGTEHRWVNRLLGIDQDFLLGNSGTLPEHPLAFIGKQVPVDIRLLTERDGGWCVDAELVASSFGPVAFDAGESLRLLPTDQVCRRVNWTFSDDGAGNEVKQHPTTDEGWGGLQLRIDVDHLIPLPMTGTSALLSRTRSATLADIATVPEWAGQLADAVEALPEAIAASKGVESCRVSVAAWLRSQIADAEEAVVQGESAA